MKLIKNMGSTDRMIRYGLAILILILYFNAMISGLLALILLVIVAVLFVTSLMSFCPLYYPFKISTRKEDEDENK